LAGKLNSSLVIPDDPPSIREQLREACRFRPRGFDSYHRRNGFESARFHSRSNNGDCGPIGSRICGRDASKRYGENSARDFVPRPWPPSATKSLILNLPGSPKGAVDSLDALADLLPHSISIIHGAPPRLIFDQRGMTGSVTDEECSLSWWMRMRADLRF